MRIADQYVRSISPNELTATRHQFEADGWRDVWFTPLTDGEGLHIRWYGTRPRCTCELYGECARCDPQREREHQRTGS